MSYSNKEDARAFQRKYYQKNRIQCVIKNKRNRDASREFINNFRHQKPCTVCKVIYPYWKLQFDHVNGNKIYNVCAMPGQFGINKIKEEMSKCEIVCINCHETRTWNKRQLTKSPRNFHYTNCRKLISIKESNPCKDCGIQYKYFVMQFDHLPGNKKLFNISLSQIVGKDWDIIQNEIKKCDIVCANCHAERTYQRKRGVA